MSAQASWPRPSPGASRAWALLGGLGTAACLALAGTEFHVVPKATGLWRGLIDPPGGARLLAALLAGALVAALLRRAPGGAARSVAWLGLAAAPLVPVTTGLGLALLAFQGPALVLVSAGVLGATVWRLIDRDRPGRPAAAPRTGLARGELLQLALAVAGYVELGRSLPGSAGPQGDEPHYLLMTDSLLSDGDLDLANQFAQRTYRSFYAGTLGSHTSPATPPGTMYQVHTPGLPALLAPAFAWRGYEGARLLLAIVAGLTTVLVHRLVADVTSSRGLALFAWASTAWVAPLPLYALSVYPETPAALATAVFLLAARRDPGPGLLAAATLAAAWLPWLHPKFLPLAVVGLGLALARRGPRGRRLVAALAFVASVAGLLAFFGTVYGRASLTAAYGARFASDVSLARLPAGLAGLLLDRQFGLAVVGSLWLVALPGLALLWRWRPGEALRSALLAAASLGVGASFSMWWGGACPPGRFVVPAVPALAVALALGARRRPAVAAALLAAGAAVLRLAAQTPSALHNRADGESGLLRHLFRALDVDGGLPSFVLREPGTWLLAVSLLAALALAWRWGARGLAAGLAAFSLVAAAQRPTALLDERQAVARLLDGWDAAHVLGLSGPLDLPALSFPLDLPGAPWTLRAGDRQRSRRVTLPPGLYRVEVDAQPVEQRAVHLARFEAQTGALSLDWVFLRIDRPLASMTLPLVVGAPRFQLLAVGVADSARVAGARLVPLALVPRGRREVFHWMAVPEQDRYRVGSDALRVTVLDRSEPEGDGFRLAGEWGDFLVETAPGAEFDLQLERPAPGAEDALHLGDQRLPLRAADTSLRLRNTAGLPLGPATVLPVTLRCPGCRVEFRAAAPSE